MQEKEGVAADMYTYASLIGACAYTRQPGIAYELVCSSYFQASKAASCFA